MEGGDGDETCSEKLKVRKQVGRGGVGGGAKW